MLKLFKQLYFSNRFFIAFSGVVVFFALGFAWPALYPISKIVLFSGLVLLLIDISLLFIAKTPVAARRLLPKMMTLGDKSVVTIQVKNYMGFLLKIDIYDELPIQFQIRDHKKSIQIDKTETIEFQYELKPVERGVYEFGAINLFIQGFFGLVERKIKEEATASLGVYPSIPQMKDMEIRAMAQTSHFQGVKKLRRLGHSYEFEQIRNYVRGDDYRSINWKATSRKNELMVNQYTDERSQAVYSIIDKSRAMKMPFEGMSLMDYAVNTSLVLSNISLKKYDKAGLISFSDVIGTAIRANDKRFQLGRILDALYAEKERPNEANYELLYHATKNIISSRSLVFLYTNFESLYAMQRVLPVLRRINKQHLLVVVFFLNTEIQSIAQEDCKDVQDIYRQTLAQKFVAEKSQIVSELKHHGIQAILTRPADLSVNIVNKYLELKARGLI